MARLTKVEILTVREIIEKIKTRAWRYDTTTQRQFIYNSSLIKKVQTDEGTMSKAAYVIYNILEKDIILPAITLWQNTDNNECNIHDGKQRSLSLYHFIMDPLANISIRRNGKTISSFNALSKADQDKLLDYKVAVQYNEGTSEEEKENFYEVNSNGVNLTDYENLRSVSYGEQIYSYEDYINGLNFDGVKKIERGEQAYKFLLAKYDINDSKQAGTLDTSAKKLRDIMSDNKLIPLKFDPTEKNFDKFIKLFSNLSRIKFVGSSKGLSEDICIAVSRHVMKSFPNRADDVVDLYIKAAKETRNDILRWASDFNNDNIQTHKTFINAYINDNIILDSRRYFDESEKQTLIDKFGQRCQHIDPATGIQCNETVFSKLAVDHINPWSKGGKTELSNAQLLCTSHNSAKGNKTK